MSNHKDVEYYMSLPYPILLIPDREVNGAWLVKIPLLQGCVSAGDTFEGAYTMIRDAQRLWLEVSIESGDAIPEPEPEPIHA